MSVRNQYMDNDDLSLQMPSILEHRTNNDSFNPSITNISRVTKNNTESQEKIGKNLQKHIQKEK